MIAEMRKHPGGSGVNMAMFAAVPPNCSRCSISMAFAPFAVYRICVERITRVG